MLQYGLYVSSSHSYTKKLRQKIFLWWHERKITDTVNSLGYYLCMAGGIGKEETRRELFMGQKAVGKVRCEFDYGAY